MIGVGTVTIAAAIGAGGLGEYIYRGLSMVDATVILAGAVPVAVLALLADALLLVLERGWSWRSRGQRASRVAVAAVLLAVGAGVALTAYPQDERIVIGSKNFTEQVILGELAAQAIERYAGLAVDRRLNLGGTFICDRAIQTGDIDLYVEYSGTALTAVFKKPVVRDPKTVLDQVRTLYADTGRSMLSPLGFNNTFAILVRADDARAKGLERLSQLGAYAPGVAGGVRLRVSGAARRLQRAGGHLRPALQRAAARDGSDADLPRAGRSPDRRRRRRRHRRTHRRAEAVRARGRPALLSALRRRARRPLARRCCGIPRSAPRLAASPAESPRPRCGA